MKIVALSFFLCSCISLGLFNVCSLYFCSLHALFCVSVFISVSWRHPVHWPLSCPLVNLLSVVYVLSVASSLYCLSFFFVPIEYLCLLKFWRTVPSQVSVCSVPTCCLPVGLFPSCRSFLSFGLCHVHRSVSSPSFFYVSILSITCLSVCFLVSRSDFCSSECFLTVGLLPVYQSFSEPSVCFQSLATCRPVPVRWSVSSFFFSVCFLSIKIGLFSYYQSVSNLKICFRSIGLSSYIFYLLPISLLPAWLSEPVSPSVFPYLGRFLVHCTGLSPVCHSESYLSACRFSVLSSVMLLVCWYSVFPANCLYPSFLPLVLFTVRWKFFKALKKYSCSC